MNRFMGKLLGDAAHAIVERWSQHKPSEAEIARTAEALGMSDPEGFARKVIIPTVEVDGMEGCVYVRYAEGESARTVELAPGIFADVDATDGLLGVEIVPPLIEIPEES